MGLASMQHHLHHQHQGPSPAQSLHLSRPSSVVHHQQPPPPSQQHHSQTHPSPQQSQGPYSSSHQLPQAYSSSSQATNSQDTQLPYYNQPSPYSNPSANSGYTSADTSEMMAAAQMPRPHYPSIPSYHTPQSNSPASVASPQQHEQQHRSIYGHPPSQHMPQSMYYAQPQYQPVPPQANPSPYAQHASHQQHSMASQPNMMMSHGAPQSQMSHASQHSQGGMTGSPRPKMEPQVPLQLQKPQSSPIPQGHHAQNGAHMHSPGNSAAGVNPNAAPGPIPATTPLVVRQDGNGVQWIAFEYSRDRVKMEYTIRCDVESVNADELSPEFKQENCVYPRACCPKDQYRGNRLRYETDCNRVGWALAQLNASLRGKRGLIQRAVDSWRNSNQDLRLRSRRVRRMAKMNHRKSSQGAPHPGAHMAGPSPSPGMASAPGPMSHSTPTQAMGKPALGSMGQPMHHHHAGGHPDSHQQGGDEVGDGDSYDHHQTPTGPGSAGGSNDVRQTQVFTGYGSHGYPAPPPPHGSMSQMGPHSSSASVSGRRHERSDTDQPRDLFPDMPEARRRKFVLVDDNVRGARVRVRVTLEGVDTNEIPDSFRKGSSVFPRSYFPREMQSPPPSAMGSHFFPDDISPDGADETEGREASRRGGRKLTTKSVQVQTSEGQECEAIVPRKRKAVREKEVKLNDLGYRMSWLQSRAFAGRTVFLQRALDTYRNKTRQSIENSTSDVKHVASHYETRAGKRRWSGRNRAGSESRDG